MTALEDELAGINALYREYARTTLPKRDPWLLSAFLSIGLLILVPTVLHRLFHLPFFRDETEIARILANLIGIIFILGTMVQDWRRRGTPRPDDPLPKRIRYLPIIASLSVFPERSLRQFSDLLKMEWAEADKAAEMAAPVFIALATLVTTLANWGGKPKVQFAFALVLIAITLCAIAYYRVRLMRLKRFEYFMQQALLR